MASAPLLPLRVGWAQWLPSLRQSWQALRRGDQLQWRLALLRWAEGERPTAESGLSGRPCCQVQRTRKVVGRGTVKRGLWPRSVLATRGQGRPASPDLLICFIIFRAATLGRVALTCPRPLGRAGASRSFGVALYVSKIGDWIFSPKFGVSQVPSSVPYQLPSAVDPKGGGNVTFIPQPHTARV